MDNGNKIDKKKLTDEELEKTDIELSQEETDESFFKRIDEMIEEVFTKD